MKFSNINRILICMTDKRNHYHTILKKIDEGILNHSQIVAAITNNESTYNYLKNTVNVPVIYYKWDKKNDSREVYDINLASKIKEFQPDTIVLTGWKHIFTTNFINQFHFVINIHPALPDSYIGLNCIKKALDDYKENKINETGVMVHHIIEELDRGEVIDYIKIPIHQQDDLTILTERFREYEKIPLINSLQTIEKKFLLGIDKQFTKL